jgi:hypothetical protein
VKALTICQPYAHIIVRGEKSVENREWPTTYRGPLLIHAGKSREWLDEGDVEYYRDIGDPMVFGAVVGVAQLIDCLHIDRIEAGEYDERHPWLREHAHTNGTWCWLLTDVERLSLPVSWKGAQGLFEIPSDAIIDVPRSRVQPAQEVSGG